MNDETKKLLEEALKSTLAALQAGIDLGKQQIPLILQQKLRYDFWESAFWLAFWLIPVILSLIFLIWAYRHKDEDNNFDMGELGSAATAFFILSSLIYLVVIGFNLPDMIKITVAPNLYLLEWLRGFIAK